MTFIQSEGGHTMSLPNQPERQSDQRIGLAAKFSFAAWAALLVVALILTPKLQSIMTRGTLLIPGTESDEVTAMTEAEFPSLSGSQMVLVFTSDTLAADDPSYQAAAEAVLAEVEQIPSVTGMTTPWNGGGETLIGQDGRSAVAMFRVKTDELTLKTEVVPQLKEITRSAPAELTVYLTGDPAVNYDLMDEILADVAVAERFVVPIILVILLIIFGSVVAAAVPLGLGLISVAISMGLFYFYALRYPVHDICTALISMMGMGVGVDYALFLVTRFREELAAGCSPKEAARRTVATSGKAIMFSGAAVIASVGSLLLVKSDVIRSLGAAMAIVIVVAVGVATTLLPPILALLGHRINALRVPLQISPASAEHAWQKWAMKIMQRPVLFTLVTLVPILLLASPAVRMSFGMPNISLLSDAAESRKGYHVLEEQFSPGLLSPFEVLLTVPEGTLADPENLDRIYEAVQALQEDPGVDSVISYVSLDPDWTLEDYHELYVDGPLQLADLTSQFSGGTGGLGQVAAALGQMQGGLLTMQNSLEQIGNGAGDLAQGALDAKAGTAEIRAGLQEAAAQVEAGAAGYQQLVEGLQMAEEQLDRAISELDDMILTTKLLDGHYRNVYEAVMIARIVLAGGTEGGPSLAESVQQGAAGLGELAAGIREIDAGLAQVEDALGALADGTLQSRDGQMQVAQALGEAANGLGLISVQLDQANEGLASLGIPMEGFDPTALLTQGDLGLRMVGSAGGEMFAQLVNLQGGADVARLLVLPTTGPDSKETNQLVPRLRNLLQAEYSDLNPKLGGYVPMMVDANDHMKWALPRVILVALIISFVVLLLLLRSVVMPLIAVVLNGLSVSAAYGFLVLIFEDGHLAGPLAFTPLYYLESPVVVVLFAILFGLSMDYQVFLLSRIKEAWDETQNNEESVAFGVAKTAGIITGAATIMVLVFLAFGLTGMLSIKEMAFGLAVAIFLDASLVRIVLAPSLMRLTGKWGWWAPAWLLRILPRLNIEH